MIVRIKLIPVFDHSGSPEFLPRTQLWRLFEVFFALLVPKLVRSENIISNSMSLSSFLPRIGTGRFAEQKSPGLHGDFIGTVDFYTSESFKQI